MSAVYYRFLNTAKGSDLVATEARYHDPTVGRTCRRDICVTRFLLWPVRMTLRPATAADDAFLEKLYASTRLEELTPLGWNAAQRDAFLCQQFVAQRSHYRTAFPRAFYGILLQAKQPVGAMIVDRTDREIRLVDLAFLPSHRGRGRGTQLLRELIEEARASNKPLRLHVLKNNPAIRLYTRLGFSLTSENGPYLKMEWRSI